MAVPTTITDLSVSEGSNSPLDSESITPTTRPSDYLRALGAIIRREQAQGVTVASAATTAIGATTDGAYIHISGVTTITGFGTVAAGIERTVVFDGILTLTHNASIILPGGASITTAAGDVAVFRSEGSGVWRCVSYSTATAASIDSTLTALAGLNSTAGLVEQTADDTFTKRPISTDIKAFLDAANNAAARTALGVSTGTVTSVSGTAPVSVATGTTTPAISMAAASAGVNGYMTGTYATKLDGIEAGANVGLPVDVGAHGVGMLALCTPGSGTIASGATAAGSNVRIKVISMAGGVGLEDGGSSTPSGTWRNISGVTANYSNSTNWTATIFQRIA